MVNATKLYYDKRGAVAVKNLQSRFFDAWYCSTKEEALAKALELIPKGSSIGWGGALSAQQIGLVDAVKNGNYVVFDRDNTSSDEEKVAVSRKCFDADYFITGANGISIDGQMVNIDGGGNRTGMIVYGPKYVIVIAGMNKVCDSIEAAVERARKIAAPMNAQRFGLETPCAVTGVCTDCKNKTSICNQMIITRNSRPAGRIKFILVGEELGL